MQSICGSLVSVPWGIAGVIVRQAPEHHDLAARYRGGLVPPRGAVAQYKRQEDARIMSSVAASHGNPTGRAQRKL